MTSQQIAAISEKIIKHFAATGSMKEAIEKVFGEGAFDQIAGDVYDALRAKATG